MGWPESAARPVYCARLKFTRREEGEIVSERSRRAFFAGGRGVAASLLGDVDSTDSQTNARRRSN